MKTVIEVARQAGVRDDGHRFEFSEYKYLERFAELVRSEERRNMLEFLTTHLKREIAEEREACAKMCEDADKSTHPADLADAIRARNKNEH